MSGVLLFVIFFALILLGGYFKAKREANSTPLKRSFNRAASLWNHADPKHRAMMLASIGVFEHSPSFAVYLASTWSQLDLKMCALLAATIDAIRENSTVTPEELVRSMERSPALKELESQPNPPTLEEQTPETPLQEIGWPTNEQIEKHFEAWQKRGQAGLLEVVKSNQRKED